MQEQVDDLQRAGLEIDVLYIRGTESRANYARAAVHLRRRLVSRPYDLVHAHYGLTGAVALTQRKVPVVTTFHGSETGYVPWQTRVSWFVARMSEPIFVSSDARVRMKLPRAHVIPVGVDVDLFRPLDRPAVRRELGWQPDARHVLLPGSRGNRRKGATLFDAVFEQVRDGAPDVQAVTLDNLSREGAARVVAASDVVLMTSRVRRGARGDQGSARVRDPHRLRAGRGRSRDDLGAAWMLRRRPRGQLSGGGSAAGVTKARRAGSPRAGGGVRASAHCGAGYSGL